MNIPAQDVSLLLSFALPLFIFLVNVWIFLFFFYRYLTRRISGMDARRDQEDAVQKKAQQILNKAHMESLDTLYKAEKKSQEMIKDTKTLNLTTEKELSEELAKSTHQELKAYVTSLHKLQDDISKEFDTLAEEFSTQTTDELKKLRQEVSEHAQHSDETLDAKVQAEFHTAQEEVAAYKKAQLENIHNLIFTITDEVVHKVVGKSLTKSDHENLVLQTLEEVQNTHVFQNS